MRSLEHENELLRSIVVDLSALVKDLLKAMPPEVKEHENSQRMLEIAEKLIDYGTQVSASGNGKQSS